MNNSFITRIYDAKEINTECLPDDPGRVLTVDSMLSDGNAFYQIKLLDNELSKDDVFSIRNNMKNTDKYNKKFIPSEGVAYLKGEYYYLYRGKIDDYSTYDQFNLEPGIYQTSDGEFVRIDPETDEEKQKYYYADKILSMNATELINAINNKTRVIRLTPDKAHSVIPDITVNDDMLKRGIKYILKDKDEDIDNYKIRFINKNELFNLKQVLRSNKPITILLFNRFINAAGLTYYIVIEESGNECIGRPLSSPIRINMDDSIEWENNRIKVSNNTDDDEYDDDDEE